MNARVVVVGGGITGLAAAWEATQRGADVTVVEADDELGGKIRSATLAGTVFDRGPDSFLARVPYGRRLVEELGAGDELTAPLAGSASVYARGELRRLPAGQLLGLPGDLAALARSGVVSWRAVARLEAERLGVGSSHPIDVHATVREALESRLGSEVVDTLVEPLIGGIYAGRLSEMEMVSAVPDVASALNGRRSVVRAVADRLAANAASAVEAEDPVFLRPRGGLHRLIELAAQRLGESGAEIITSATCDHLVRERSGFTAHVACRGAAARTLQADAVVLCVPAWRAGPLLAEVDSSLPGLLARVPSAGVSMATFALASDALQSFEGAGFLVPRTSKAVLTAATFISSKWGQRGAGGETLLRLSAGYAGDHRHESLDDVALAETLAAEFERFTHVPLTPVEWRVDRWPTGFPQYRVGHAHVVAAARAALSGQSIAIAGASYEGVGVGACIRQGREAATQVLDALATAKN